MLGVGIVATILVTALITRRAKREFQEMMARQQQEEGESDEPR